jgi:hypothetical protein
MGLRAAFLHFECNIGLDFAKVVAKPHGRCCPIPKFANDRVEILHLLTGDCLFFYPQVKINQVLFC